MDESALNASLVLYKTQLNQVNEALSTSNENAQDLLQLRNDLTELVALTEESLLSLRKSQLLQELEGSTSSAGNGTAFAEGTSNIDAEMAAFKAAIVDDSSSSTDTSNKQTDIVDEDDNKMAEIEAKMNELVGTKCRVQYQQEWGALESHNCLVMSAEPVDLETGELKVRVVFCNPTHKSMLPCPYFLDGECRFSEEECRFSHGYVVSLQDLLEFKDPDYVHLKMDNHCLAKHTDGIWYKATVIEVDLNGHTCIVHHDSYDDTVTVSLSDVVPLESIEREEEQEFELSSSDSEFEYSAPIAIETTIKTTDALGQWEKHTKGIGSKLMAKMGYITGQGLGKDGKGRATPVPINVLPKGNLTLDKIMELREKFGSNDMVKVKIKEKKKQKKKEQKIVKRYNKEEKGNMFDFINKKLEGKKGNLQDLVMRPKGSGHEKPRRQISERDLKEKSDKNINVQLFKTGEEIRKVEFEIKKLKEGIERNKGVSLVTKKLREKLGKMEKYLAQLMNSEKSIQKHQKSRSGDKKLSIF